MSQEMSSIRHGGYSQSFVSGTGAANDTYIVV